jgi:hypothetical protein
VKHSDQSARTLLTAPIDNSFLEIRCARIDRYLSQNRDRIPKSYCDSWIPSTRAKRQAPGAAALRDGKYEFKAASSEAFRVLNTGSDGSPSPALSNSQ